MALKSVYNCHRFPTASAFGHTLAGAAVLCGTARTRVQVETFGPPVFGKGTAASVNPFLSCLSARVFPKADMHRLRDKHGRYITDLRVSITDHCNYRCVYCRTGNEGAMYADLPFADYLRMARVFAGLGIEKIRITGGEPLLRRGVVDFVRELSGLRTLTGGPLDLAITTNGHLQIGRAS